MLKCEFKTCVRTDNGNSITFNTVNGYAFKWKYPKKHFTGEEYVFYLGIYKINNKREYYIVDLNTGLSFTHNPIKAPREKAIQEFIHKLLSFNMITIDGFISTILLKSTPNNKQIIEQLINTNSFYELNK